MNLSRKTTNVRRLFSKTVGILMSTLGIPIPSCNHCDYATLKLPHGICSFFSGFRQACFSLLLQSLINYWWCFLSDQGTYHNYLTFQPASFSVEYFPKICSHQLFKYLYWLVVRSFGFLTFYRVATAQGKSGKQGIWMYIFPDRENTGNLPKNIKNMILHREFNSQHREILSYKIKTYFRH